MHVRICKYDHPFFVALAGLYAVLLALFMMGKIGSFFGITTRLKESVDITSCKQSSFWLPHLFRTPAPLTIVMLCAVSLL